LDELLYQDKEILEGRFFGNALQYVPKAEVPVYYLALTPSVQLDSHDLRLLEFIRDNGPVPKDVLYKWVNLSKRDLERSLWKLDLSLKIVRAGWIRERSWGEPLWDTFEKWLPQINLEALDPACAKEQLVLKFLKLNGILKVTQLLGLFRGSLTPREVLLTLESLIKRGLVVAGRFLEGEPEEQYADPLTLEALFSFRPKVEPFVFLIAQGDPFAIVWKDKLWEIFSIKAPAARGPAWISYIFSASEPCGFVDYKWRAKKSEIQNLVILPSYLTEDFLGRLLPILEENGAWMGHQIIEIHRINDVEAAAYEETLVGGTFRDFHYIFKEGKALKEIP